jgi:copper(I)-binding protein
MKIRHIAGIAALALSTPLVAVLAMGEHQGIMVMEPFARETPPNAQVAGAYMTLMNHGADDRLIGASTDAAARVEIHNHTMENGVMRMREVEGGLSLPKGETVTLQPGGLHVMLMGLEAPLKQGETLDLTLEFESGETIDVSVPVKKIGAAAGSSTGSSSSHKHQH